MAQPQLADIDPIDGWGFFERDTDTLARVFKAEVRESGPTANIFERGWIGKVISKDHRYFSMDLEMSPRNEPPWNEIVVISIFDGQKSLEESLVYSGMAQTKNLECSWQ